MSWYPSNMSLINTKESHTIGRNIYNMYVDKGSHSEYIRDTHKSIRKRANPIQNEQDCLLLLSEVHSSHLSIRFCYMNSP